MSTLRSRIHKLEQKLAVHADPPGDTVTSSVSTLRRLTHTTPPEEPNLLDGVSDETVFQAYEYGLKDVLPLLPRSLHDQVVNKLWRALVDRVIARRREMGKDKSIHIIAEHFSRYQPAAYPDALPSYPIGHN